MLHPESPPRRAYVEQLLDGVPGPFVACSDYVRAVPEQLGPWIPGEYLVLGTDGLGRSDTRAALRRHFEVDAASIAVAALHQLYRQGKIPASKVRQAIGELGVDPEKVDPLSA